VWSGVFPVGGGGAEGGFEDVRPVVDPVVPAVVVWVAIAYVGGGRVDVGVDLMKASRSSSSFTESVDVSVSLLRTGYFFA
jgi:hypothetical protein